jgi:hypothetical protein
VQHYLPGAALRARWMRMDAAAMLKRLFFCERTLIIAQAGWIASIAHLEVKLGLARLLWLDSLTAHSLRERVFELRYPSRLMEIGDDAPLIQLYTEATNAPSPEAFLMALGRVLKPALLDAYTEYLGVTDEVADGPTLRFMQIAVQDKIAQLTTLVQYSEELLAANPARREEAQRWSATLAERVRAVAGLSLLGLLQPVPNAPALPASRPFAVAETPARDQRFHLCRYYWPDAIDPSFPYGEELRLQLRSAISHLNEVWAVESAGAALYVFGDELGWEYILDAARWTYDESRHVRMGYERLLQWGFELAEIPLGAYIYESARGQDPFFRLAMLFYFETKNIGKKLERAETFARYHDQVSRHDMEFDWADETIHAGYGRRWIGVLHANNPQRYPAADAVREQCEGLVQVLTATATEAERRAIRQVAEAMIAKAERRAEQSAHQSAQQR